MGLALHVPVVRAGEPLRIVFIGRLDSYKRLDWLFDALAQLSTSWKLVVVGDGPKRFRFEQLADRRFGHVSPVSFLGRLSEAAKFEQIAAADLLVLPSSCSNEAFGIVQLEAMAAGRIALAFDQPRSGMSWVSSLSGLPWSHSREVCLLCSSGWRINRLCVSSCACSQGSVTPSCFRVVCGLRSSGSTTGGRGYGLELS